MNTSGTDNYDQTCETALGWIARLRADDVSQRDRESFALWLGQDKSNAHAMDRMLDLWDDLGVVRLLPQETASEPKAANNSRWLPSSIALAACLVLAIFLWPQFSADPISTQYKTAMGERLSIELPDQSRVILNTDSSISVTYTDDQRHILLSRGEAWFQVQPNPDQPFHVDAGETRTTAIGTAFNIYKAGSGTDITVTEGVVRVTELGETGSRAPTTEVLHKNQQLHAAQQDWQLSTNNNLQRQLAWQRGELLADEMPLPVLIAELQRYNPTDILITDPELAVLTVSGVFQLDQPESILRALEVTLAVQVSRVDANTVHLIKSPQ